VDFVLTRIHEVIESELSAAREHELEKHDIDWGRVLELQLVHTRRRSTRGRGPRLQNGRRRFESKGEGSARSYLLRSGWSIVPRITRRADLNTGCGQELAILYGVANAHLAPGYRE